MVDQTAPSHPVTNSAPAASTASIVIPTYNESENVGRLMDEIHNVLTDTISDSYSFHVLFIDDGSTDGTSEKLDQLALEYSSVQVVHLSRNFGQTAALAAGVDLSDADIIITMDADGQNDPADIPKLLDKFEEGYDCVSGWRKERNDPLTKRIPSAIQTRLAWLTGPDIHDFGCTLKVYDSRAISDIHLLGESHRYIPAQLHQRGYRITEMPVNHRPREHGTTKYGAGRLLRGFLDFTFNFFWARFATRPIHFLGAIGLLFIAVGGIVGSHALFVNYAFDAALSSRLPRLIMVVGFILFGFQLVTFGFIAEMIVKLYYKDEKPYRIRRHIK
jgi:glycosyltransferase involved in cell wall biosynthesis